MAVPWLASRQTVKWVLSGLIIAMIAAGALVWRPQPANALFFNPPISCNAFPVTQDQLTYKREYSEGSSYWSWEARTRVECHFFSITGSSYDFQTYARAVLYHSYDGVNPMGSTNSGTWSSYLIYGTHVQRTNPDMWASYQWTSCVSSQRYVIKTEAFYRYKVRGTTNWSRWDSHQERPAISANLKLC